MKTNVFLILSLSIALFSSCNKDEIQPNNENNNQNIDNIYDVSNWPVIMEADIDFVELNQLDADFKGKSTYSAILNGTNLNYVAQIEESSNGEDNNLHINSTQYQNGEFSSAIYIDIQKVSGSTEGFQTGTYSIDDPDFEVSFGYMTFDSLNTFVSDASIEGYTYESTGDIINPTGSITITSIDLANNTIKGTFEFEGYSIAINDNWESVAKYKVMVKNGTFEGAIFEP